MLVVMRVGLLVDLKAMMWAVQLDSQMAVEWVEPMDMLMAVLMVEHLVEYLVDVKVELTVV